MASMYVGLRRALAIVTAVTLTGCSLDGLFGSDGGRVRMVLSRDDGGALNSAVANIFSQAAVLTDRDDDDDENRGIWRFQTATVTLSSILARTQDGELVALNLPLPLDVDVVKIDGGKQLQLPDAVLDADTYDQVVLVISEVQGVTHDGTIVTIDPPGGGWTAVVPICPLEVTQGQTATVGLALNVRSSFLQVGNWWSFSPRFRSLLDCDDD